MLAFKKIIWINFVAVSIFSWSLFNTKDAGPYLTEYTITVYLVLFVSMGGAIATHVVSRNIIPSVIGLIVIDVVEG